MTLKEEGAEANFIPFTFFYMFDPMSELSGSSAIGDDDRSIRSSVAPRRQFANDIHSITIHASQRTFYVDLKESGNGKFFKVSEKSRGGQKTTIMFDVEDLDRFIVAFQEMKGKL
jgi:hypothetical protein